MTIDLHPDLEQASRFLNTLDASGAFSFQLFVDSKASSEKEKERFKRLASIKHGTLEKLSDDLVRLNTLPQEEHPRGVYVTVNKTNGNGRKKENIVGVRAVFVDLDGAPIDPVINGPLAPSIIVQSSPGKYHAYWLVDDFPLDEFTPFQKMLADRFNGDPSVCDWPRVLRVPGFLHNKAEPFVSHLLKSEPTLRYSRDQLVDAFGNPATSVKAPAKSEVPAMQNGACGNDHLNRAKAAQIAGKAAERIALDPNRGRHRQGLWVGWEARRQGLSSEDAEVAAAIFHDLVPDTDSDGKVKSLSEAEIQETVLNAYAEGKEPERAHGLIDFILRGPEIATLPNEPRKPIVEPFITESSLSMVWAKRGAGKTWFALQLAYSCATGTKFLSWNVAGPRRVLYVDGEMPQADLVQRVQHISGNNLPDNLMMLPSERLFLEDCPPSGPMRQKRGFS